MPTAARQAAVVLLDTAAFYYFEEAAQLMQLQAFLQRNGGITNIVHQELTRANRAGMLTRQGWPPVHRLTSRQLVETQRLQRATLQPGDRADKNLGEISTVVLAQGLPSVVTVIDDDDGKRLAHQRGVARISTGQLIQQMVADASFNYSCAEGYHAWVHATPSQAHPHFKNGLRQLGYTGPWT